MRYWAWCWPIVISCMLSGVISAAETATAGKAAPDKPLASFDLVRGVEPATIVLARSEHKGVMAAAKDLQRDVTKIAGVTPNIVHSLSDCAGPYVVLGSADCAEGKKLLAAVGLAVDDLAGKWECFKYRVLNGVGGKEQVLAIAGSDFRGTIFGLYDFEQKHLGVDPFWFWADHEPATRGELIFDQRIDFGPTKEPTWRYRGWTLNDHPQFMEWIESGLVQRTRYSRYMFAIHPEVFQRLWEAALRLKMNMFTWYFVDIDWQPDYERLRAAVDRGLFVTQHQMEAVGADTGYWDTYWRNHNPAGKPEVFSYKLHPEAFREFFGHYIRRWSEFSPQVVWELNLRGWADGPYEEPSLPDGGTPEQRCQIISQAISDQAKLVRQLDPNPRAEMMTTLYAEVGKNYDRGWIKVPPEVTTGFADAGMNGMSYSKKFWTEPRDPQRKYGQYFHTQYFGGGPQIAKCTPVETYLKVNLDAMYQRGDTWHMLLAMNELRHQQIEIRAVAEMLWDYPGFRAREYLLRYCRDEFGASAVAKVLALYDAYYEKYPHKMLDDGFKKYPSYYKVMEPAFTVTANLLNIESGNRDGFALAYGYDKKVYQQGIDQLGEVLAQAKALRPSIPEDRRAFFDYEFLDSIPQIRGIYRLSIATQEAIQALAKGDRKAALAELNGAAPLAEELYRGFLNNTAGEKWKYWYRSGTNEDFYLLYNLFQKARLRLQVEPLDFVTAIQPQRHPYRGNVVLHTPAAAGDAVYSSQAERLNSSVYNGAPYSIVATSLRDCFQIGGVQSTYSKWKQPVADYALAYEFQLQGMATVYVAQQAGRALPWLAEQGFRKTQETLTVGQWGWPYRYRNRPPERVHTFEVYSKDFAAGPVKLGKNPPRGKGLPYIVFIQPRLLAFENFRSCSLGAQPAGWKIAAEGGLAELVANRQYAGDMRPSVFDLATVPRYQPLELVSLRLAPHVDGKSAATAELPFRQAAAADFVVNLRMRVTIARDSWHPLASIFGDPKDRGSCALLDRAGQAGLNVEFNGMRKIVCRFKDNQPVEIAPYEAGRWYNLQLRVTPREKKYSIAIHDDQAGTIERSGLEWSATGEAAAIRFIAGPAAATEGAMTEIGAVDAWIR